MGVDQLVTGGDVNDPDVDSLTTDKRSFTEGYTEVEDGNSPWSVSGAQSHTYTLSQTYDQVLLIVEKIKNDAGSSQDIQLQVNGQTGGYRQRTDDGASSTGLSQITLDSSVSSLRFVRGEILFGGIYDGVSLNVPRITARQRTTTGAAVHGRCIDASTDLSQFTIKGASGNIDIQARVIGRTI